MREIVCETGPNIDQLRLLLIMAILIVLAYLVSLDRQQGEPLCVKLENGTCLDIGY